MPVLLSESDVRAVLSMDDLIDAMETALDRFSAGCARQPLRSVIDVGARGSDHAFYGVMPALLQEPAVLGTKLVSVYSANAARGLPTHLATIVLLDPETGALSAIIDGRYITEARTAAVSAASARHLRFAKSASGDARPRTSGRSSRRCSLKSTRRCTRLDRRPRQYAVPESWRSSPRRAIPC
jgi:ornithine cyclodeaminase/alanine dehydrogenase-like protein (mu-crystallin family)